MKRFISAFLVLVSILTVTSCNDSSVGVFYGLSREEKVRDYSLPNKCTSEDMIKTGGYLYLAAGSIYKKLAEGGELDWHRIDCPDGYAYTSQIGLFNSDIYIVSFDSDDAETYLFKGDGSGTWEMVSTPIDKIISRMQIVNNVIFLSDKHGNLYYSTDGSSFTQDTSLPGGKLFITSTGAFDIVSDGSNYYLNAQYKIYRGTYGSWTEISPLKSNGHERKDEEYIFTYLFFDDGETRLYAADNSGYVYAVDSPASASGTAWVQSDNSAPSGIGIESLVVVRIPYSGGTHTVLLCGSGVSGGKGYFEVHNPRTSDDYLNPKRPKNSISIVSDYYDFVAFDLSHAAINSFFVDEYSDGSFDFYALTYGFGVWKNTNKGDYRRGWNRE